MRGIITLEVWASAVASGSSLFPYIPCFSGLADFGSGRFLDHKSVFSIPIEHSIIIKENNGVEYGRLTRKLPFGSSRKVELFVGANKVFTICGMFG